MPRLQAVRKVLPYGLYEGSGRQNAARYRSLQQLAATVQISARSTRFMPKKWHISCISAAVGHALPVTGTPLPGLYTEAEALDMIEKAMLLFRDWGQKGERFAAMIDRIGEDKVVDALLHGDLLARRDEILAKEI